jgi:hypothetical protein
MSLSAQNDYGKFDIEIGFDVPLAASKVEGTTNSVVPFLYVEGRWQLETQPLDVGFHVGISGIKRKSSGGHDNYNTFTILAVTDWQFGRGKRINPFIGTGLGVSKNGSPTMIDGNKWAFAATPRVGVRFFQHVNFSVGYLATQKDYSRLYCNLGLYF